MDATPRTGAAAAETAATETAARPAPEAARRRALRFDVPVPWLFAGLITVILVVGEAFFQILGGYERLVVAHVSAIGTEVVLSRLMRKRWPNLISAYITANSIAILVKSVPLWPFAFGSILSIMSKYVLTYRRQHLWNPSNFGICALLTLAPGVLAILSHEWSNSKLAVGIVFTVGFAVAARARLLHISGTYFVAFLVLAIVRSSITGSPVATAVAPVTGPMYQLFMFFMITDPRTVVGTRSGRITVAVIIALAEMGIRLLDQVHWPALEFLLRAPPMYALWIVGPIAKWIDVARTARVAAARAPQSV